VDIEPSRCAVISEQWAERSLLELTRNIAGYRGDVCTLASGDERIRTVRPAGRLSLTMFWIGPAWSPEDRYSRHVS
jgi:hypothetical protein